MQFLVIDYTTNGPSKGTIRVAHPNSISDTQIEIEGTSTKRIRGPVGATISCTVQGVANKTTAIYLFGIRQCITR